MCACSSCEHIRYSMYRKALKCEAFINAFVTELANPGGTLPNQRGVGRILGTDLVHCFTGALGLGALGINWRFFQRIDLVTLEPA